MCRALTLLFFLCVVAIQVNAAGSPFSILVDRGTLSLLPLRALSAFLGAEVKFSGDDPRVFSLAYHNVYADYDGTSQVVVDGKGNAMPLAPLCYAGELYLPARWLADTYGFTLDWHNAPLVRSADSPRQCLFPVGVMLPDIGNSSESPYGLRVETTAYVRLDALPLFFGARWAEATGNGKQTVTLDGHMTSFTAYSAQYLVDGHAHTLEALPVRYADHLYVPVRALAEALRLLVTQEYSPETFTLCHPGGMKTIVEIAVKISHITADFAGDGVMEQAYATCAEPGDTTPSLVWVARGTRDIWQRVLGNGNSRAIVKLQARDLTGDGHPELTYACWFIGAYVDAVGFTAYQWQEKGHTFRNIMGPDSEAGFLTYPASNRGDGGIMLQPGDHHTHAPQLIQYQTVESFDSAPHYQARWYRWNGVAFQPFATRRTRARYTRFDKPQAIGQALKRLHVSGIPLMKGEE